MKTKIMKPLIQGGVILLCLSVLGSLLSSSVLAQEPNEKSGELERDQSDSIPFEIKVGEMVQGELACEKALSVIIVDPTLKESVDFGSINGSFFYAAETEGKYYIQITNPTNEPVGYTLTYTVLPTSLAPGTASTSLLPGQSDYILFEIKVGEMIQGELACKEALRVIITDFTRRESVDFGKIDGSFFYAAETEGKYYIVITNPTEAKMGIGEGIGYAITYTVLPTSLAPGTSSAPSMLIRNLLAIILGVPAVGGIIYLFIRRKKKKREEFERDRDAFRKRIKMTE